MNATIINRLSGFAVVGLALSVSLPSHAQTWDANADFTSLTTNNPNGVWSYGYDASAMADYHFKPFDTFTLGVLTAWTDGSYVVSGTPTFARNDGLFPVSGLPSGQIALHPGPDANGDAAILRFTAPATGFYAVSAQFLAGDTGETEAWVLRNEVVDSPLASLGVTSANPLFASRSVSLLAGDTLDFVVGNLGDYNGDTTPLSVQISAVPEPTTALMALVGSMLLLGVSRRQRQ